MADAWEAVLGQSHAMIPIHKIEDKLDELMRNTAGSTASQQLNDLLMSQVQEEDIAQAIKNLQRHKAGGTDGLTNDLYNDLGEVVVSTLTSTINSIMDGAAMPSTFLESLVVPLRKSGDSANPMDYLPISMLATGYKILAAILAARLQTELGGILDEAQQGFAKDRRMERSITLMQAVMKQQYSNYDQSQDDSPVVLLLEFRKAYDTLDRNDMLAVLRGLGFSESFIELIRRTHADTSARLLVNGEMSTIRKVVSGIRQGCSLAPLLFVLAVEPLARALDSDEKLNGIQVAPGRKHHKASIFVDDTSVLLSKMSEMARVQEKLVEFGALSGLVVQPTKSWVIPINRARPAKMVMGYPVLQPECTTRYLGIRIGTCKTKQANWEIRISKIRALLAIATQVANSELAKVVILNAIVLPAVLFTSTYAPPTPEIVQQIELIQKRFLWYGTSEVDRVRHKINAGLLFAPVQTGGLGLTAIPLTTKRHAMRHATRWILSPKTEHTAAWHKLAHPGIPHTSSCCTITPRRHTARANNVMQRNGTAAAWGRLLLEYHLNDSNEREHDWIARTSALIKQELARSSFEWNGETVKTTRATDQRAQRDGWTKELLCYWPKFTWNDNAWLIDQDGKVLTSRKHNFVKSCTIEDLEITRTGECTYTSKPPQICTAWNATKVRRWTRLVVCILVCTPEIAIGATMRTPDTLKILARTDVNNWRWRVETQDTVVGTTSSGTDAIRLSRSVAPPLWEVTAVAADLGDKTNQTADLLQTEARVRGVVLAPHPATSQLSWQLPELTSPRWVLRAMDKNRSRTLSTTVKSKLTHVLEHMKRAADQHEWAAAVQTRPPADIWKRAGLVTDFQRWVGYRDATCQLNLFHSNWTTSRDCTVDNKCSGTRETSSHIMWECTRAQTAWNMIFKRWTGEAATAGRRDMMLPHIAGRSPPPTQLKIRDGVLREYGWFKNEHDRALVEIWFFVVMATPATLWRLRNEKVHQQLSRSCEECCAQIWSECAKQVRAVACNRKTQRGRQIEGAAIEQCWAALTEEPLQLMQRNSEWRKARLYFDGGSRGNPGPGGSGWALLKHDGTQWDLQMSGYTYQGLESTNNYCEYEALREGLARAYKELRHEPTHLQVFGDSGMIIDICNGTARSTATNLLASAKRVKELASQFTWTSWHHVNREFNKMADLLANVVMDS